MQRSLHQVPFEGELSHSLFRTYKVSLDRLEDNIYTLIRQGFSIDSIDNLDYWRYETYVEKTIEWFEAIKDARESAEQAKDGRNKAFEISNRKPPEEWNIGAE